MLKFSKYQFNAWLGNFNGQVTHSLNKWIALIFQTMKLDQVCHKVKPFLISSIISCRNNHFERFFFIARIKAYIDLFGHLKFSHKDCVKGPKKLFLALRLCPNYCESTGQIGLKVRYLESFNNKFHKLRFTDLLFK